ncbi:MAG: head decoration protein, partial [Chloroflexota bacterium]
PGDRSREAVTVLSGQTLLPGAVLGAIGLATPATATAFAGNTGNGTMAAAPTVGAGAQVGTYKLTVVEPGTNAGKFAVEDPGGIEIGTGTVGVAFSAGGLGFTLQDGSADFISGDGFDIVVGAGSLKVRAIDFSSTVGADKAAGILYGPVDASAADARGVAHVRDAVVIAVKLIWPAGATSDQKTAALAQLKAQGIIAR